MDNEWIRGGMMSDSKLATNSAGIEFVPLGELLAVDLVNTEIEARRKRYDLLQTPQDAVDWFQQMVVLRPEEHQVAWEEPLLPAADLLDRLKPLRALLRQLFGDIVAGKAIDGTRIEFINTALNTGNIFIRSTPEQSFEVAYQPASTSSASIVLACALSAMRLLTERDLGRLHTCRNPHCVLFFYDLTRNATREWCSIECMDRARSAERYRQLKASQGE